MISTILTWLPAGGAFLHFYTMHTYAYGKLLCLLLFVERKATIAIQMFQLKFINKKNFFVCHQMWIPISFREQPSKVTLYSVGLSVINISLRVWSFWISWSWLSWNSSWVSRCTLNVLSFITDGFYFVLTVAVLMHWK